MKKPPALDDVHWLNTASAAPDCAQLEGTLDVDVLVVGAGLTGCRTALGLAEAGTTVAVVDANDIGWGASGRSGGQCNPMWRKTPDQLIAHLGPAHGEKLIQTTLQSADNLFADISCYDIDCDAVQAGWVQAAHTKKAQRNLQTLAETWADAGAHINVLEGGAVTDVSGSPAYSFALRHATGGHVHPLSLTRGFARAAIAHGALIFERSPVTKLERIYFKWTAQTPNGLIKADNVVITTNGYTNGLWPVLQKTFHPMVSISLATQPLTQAQQETVLPGNVTISDTRSASYYARYDRDGRLIFGCVGSNDAVDTLGGISRLQQGLRTVFPQIADIGIERAWAGRIAVTPDMMPHIYEPAPGILAGLGFCGRGIAMTSVMGRTLCEKLLGAPEDELPCPVVPLTPMPLHNVTRSLIPLAAPAFTLKDRFDTYTNGV